MTLTLERAHYAQEQPPLLPCVMGADLPFILLNGWETPGAVCIHANTSLARTDGGYAPPVSKGSQPHFIPPGGCRSTQGHTRPCLLTLRPPPNPKQGTYMEGEPHSRHRHMNRNPSERVAGISAPPGNFPHAERKGGHTTMHKMTRVRNGSKTFLTPLLRANLHNPGALCPRTRPRIRESSSPGGLAT